MTNPVLDLLSKADTIAVDLHPLDAIHAQAAARLAEMEAGIAHARSEVEKALSDKSALSKQFEDVVGELGRMGVDRDAVERAVGHRIETLLAMGLLKAQPRQTAAVAPVEKVAAPAVEKVAAQVPEKMPAAVVEVPPAPSPAVSVAAPEASAPRFGILPADDEPESSGETAPPAEEATGEEAVVRLPLAVSRPAEPPVASPIPASRPRRPRAVSAVEADPTPAPTIEDVAAVNATTAAIVEPVDEVVETAAATAPEVTELEVKEPVPAPETIVATELPKITPESYGNVVDDLDEDADSSGEAAPVTDADEPEDEVVSEEEDDTVDASEVEDDVKNDVKKEVVPTPVEVAPAFVEAPVAEASKAPAEEEPAPGGVHIPDFLRNM